MVQWRSGPPATPEQAHACDGGRVTLVFMFYYTYVLLSLKDNNLYIGWSNNLKARLHKHCSGLVAATKHRLPLKLVYYEACLDQQKAIQREKYFKSGFGRRFLKNRIIY